MTKGEEIQDSAKELADAHWKWVRECLDRFADYDESWSQDDLIEHMEWAFKNGFVHGFKHGKEEEKNNYQGPG